ncbi:MAG: thiol-disulfide oxidoreductase DCC family protein [Solirubrobacterales bacterium]
MTSAGRGDETPAVDGARTDGEQLTILYDRDCGFCKWSLDKVLAWDRHGRLRPLAVQSDDGRHLLRGLPADARLDSWHLVLTGGEIRSAGAAAAPLAALLPGGRPLAAVFRAFPASTERGYRLVARNRDRLARLLRIDAGCELRR